MLRVKRPVPCKNETPKEESEKALTVEQLRYVLSCASQEPRKWEVFIHIAADTGARKGEICGLQWADIDWKSGAIKIRRNLQYTAAAGIYETTPKSGKARVVDIGPETLALLRRLREEQSQSCVSKWVFAQEGSAEPMHPETPTTYFRNFGKRYSIKNFHPHLLRHTAASIVLTKGADILSVSERLGHSSPTITLNMYGHANQESIRAAGQVGRDAVKKAQNE